MLRDKLTLTIHSCDKFSDLWDAHVKLLNKNWNDRNIATFIVTDKKVEKKYDGLDIFSAGDGFEMPQRINAMLDSVKTEYILLTLDDYFPIYPIYSEKIERLINIMDELSLDYLRLFPIPKAKKKIEGYEKLYEIELNEEYDVNLYQGIWRKSFLEKTVKESLDPWKYEVSLTNIAREYKAKCALSMGKEFEILDVVRKGKLLTKANKYLKKHDLYHGERPVISRKTEILLKIKGWGKWICPKSFRKYAKSILRIFGVHFYSDLND